MGQILATIVEVGTFTFGTFILCIIKLIALLVLFSAVVAVIFSLVDHIRDMGDSGGW